MCRRGFDNTTVSDVTTFDSRGFPKYRRPSVDDLKVVPYHPAMLRDWNGHLCFEYSGSVFTIFYLYSYVYKGSKKVDLCISNTSDVNKKDEILLHLRGRKICSMDVVWRVFRYQTYPASKPSVTTIKIKSETFISNQRQEGNVSDFDIYLHRPSNEDCSDISRSDIIINETHREFFIAEHFNNMTFKQFHAKYITYRGITKFKHTRPYLQIDMQFRQTSDTTLSSSSSSRQKRKSIDPVFLVLRTNETSIVRLESVPITCGEMFYLRLIVLNCGIFSFTDAKTHLDIEYNTFQERAFAAGYVKEGEECLTAFRESILCSTPAELRGQFTTMTLEGFPTLCVWNDTTVYPHCTNRNRMLTFRQFMFDDYLHDIQPQNETLAYNKLLKNLYDRFANQDKELPTYGLPNPEDTDTLLQRHKLKYAPAAQLILYNQLNARYQNNFEQQVFFDAAVNIVNSQTPNGKGKFIFLNGDAGTGKTFITKKLVAYFRAQGKTVGGCCSTGLATQNYEPGDFTTAHTFYAYPVVEEYDLNPGDGPIQCRLDQKPQRLELIQAFDVIFHDELTNNHFQLLEAAANATNNFEGKVLIGLGDWKQILPIVSGSELKSDILNACHFNSNLWKEFDQYSLTEVMRLKNPNLSPGERAEQEAYAAMIQAIGNINIKISHKYISNKATH